MKRTEVCTEISSIIRMQMNGNGECDSRHGDMPID